MIRRYTIEDIPVLVERAQEFFDCSPNYRYISYDKSKMRAWFLANLNNKSFFCNLAVNEDGEYIGILCASIAEYVFSREVFASDEFFYIPEDRKSLRLATELVGQYVAWGKERRVRELRLSSTTGVKPEKFAKLCEFLKFEKVGPIYRMEL